MIQAWRSSLLRQGTNMALRRSSSVNASDIAIALDQVLFRPQWLEVGVMAGLSQLIEVLKIERGQGLDVVDVPASPTPIFPSHPGLKLSFKMTTEFSNRTA